MTQQTTKMTDKTNANDNDVPAVEHGVQVTIEAKTRAEAAGRLSELRKQAADKGLDAVGGFIVYDYDKDENGENPFITTVEFIDPKSI